MYRTPCVIMALLRNFIPAYLYIYDPLWMCSIVALVINTKHQPVPGSVSHRTLLPICLSLPWSAYITSALGTVTTNTAISIKLTKIPTLIPIHLFLIKLGTLVNFGLFCIMQKFQNVIKDFINLPGLNTVVIIAVLLRIT